MPLLARRFRLPFVALERAPTIFLALLQVASSEDVSLGTRLHPLAAGSEDVSLGTLLRPLAAGSEDVSLGTPIRLPAAGSGDVSLEKPAPEARHLGPDRLTPPRPSQWPRR